MLTLKKVGAIFLLNAMLSCGVNQNKLLESEVMRLHDEVMPKLELMKRQKRSLVKTSFASERDSIKAHQVVKELTYGDSVMWAWMYQYRPVETLRDSLDEDEINLYLEEQLIKVTHVNSSIKNAIHQADELILQ